jgi:hypothetical protein
MSVTCTERLVASPALDDAYRTLGLLPTAHDLVVAKARTALLVFSTTAAREVVIEEAYRRIMLARMRAKAQLNAGMNIGARS